jgi:HEAT repeat protein
MQRGTAHALWITMFTAIALGPLLAQAPPSIEAELNRYGIPLTQGSLRAALQDGRPSVRSLAAGELAAMNDTASAPQIVNALLKEHDPQVELNMATALLTLGSEDGKKVLLRLCDDSGVPADLRLNAALRIMDSGDTDCLRSVLDTLRETTNPSIKTSALLALRHLNQMPASLSLELNAVLQESLRDEDATVRFYASECIAALGDKDAIPSLKSALASETDPSTQQKMREALRSLQQKP